ncbi:MAG: rhodanese-like domain-containing protein [Lewinellaceae bacterium]|nr:rhodanese-like domain-containing protein [Saprospiraceae bacterium]MCB9340097.1 rhodanese-like domain-containing protein [Lewinellaceae bacterium]
MFNTSSIDQARQHLVRQLLDEGAVLLDVRTHCEHAGYHIEGAINIPYDEIGVLKAHILAWDKPIITFSTYGRRSQIAAEKLKSLGLEVLDAGSMFLVENAIREGVANHGFNYTGR